MTSFSGRVLPWSARSRAAAPLALAGSCLLLFFLGLMSPSVRTDAHLRPVMWTLLVGAGIFILLWVGLLARLGGRVVVDDGGVRITGRAPIELGRPRSLRHGRHDRLAPGGRVTPHLWIAVEGADGRVVIFRRLAGLFARLPDWPAAQPPTGGDVFDCAAIDPAALRAACAGLVDQAQ